MTTLKKVFALVALLSLALLPSCTGDDDDWGYRVRFVSRSPVQARTPFTVYVTDRDGRVGAGAWVYAWVPDVEHIYGRRPIEVRVDQFGYAEVLPEAAIPYPIVSGEWALEVEGDLGRSEVFRFDVLPYAVDIAATQDTWQQGQYIELGLVETAGNAPTDDFISDTQFAVVDAEGRDMFPANWGIADPNGIFGFFNNLPPGIYTLEGWERGSGFPSPIREIEVLPANVLSLGSSRFPRFQANGQPLPPSGLFANWDSYAWQGTETFFVMQNSQVDHSGGQFLVFGPNAWEPWQMEVFTNELSALWTPWEPGVYYTAASLELPAGQSTSAFRRHLALRPWW